MSSNIQTYNILKAKRNVSGISLDGEEKSCWIVAKTCLDCGEPMFLMKMLLVGIEL